MDTLLKAKTISPTRPIPLSIDLNLVEAKRGNNVLLIAVSMSHVAMVKSLVGMPDVELYKCNKNLDNALTLAAREGNIEVMQIVLTAFATASLGVFFSSIL